MDSLLFSAPFSKGAFGVFWTGFVDSVRTGVSFVAKLWCRLRYVLFCRSGKKEVDGGGKACYTIIQCLTTIMPLDLLRAAIAFRPTGVVN